MSIDSTCFKYFIVIIKIIKYSFDQFFPRITRPSSRNRIIVDSPKQRCEASDNDASNPCAVRDNGAGGKGNGATDTDPRKMRLSSVIN